MAESLARDWVRGEDQECSTWEAGFQPVDLTDACASGSSSLGQLADLFNTSTFSEWPVVIRRNTIPRLHLIKHAEICAGWEAAYIQFPDDHKFEKVDFVRATAEKIEHIRDIFGLSISHLAKILRTSRPSVYKWLEGEEPREQFAARIQQLCKFADHFSEMNPHHFSPGPLLRQPLDNSPSLLELLEREKLMSDEVELGLSTILDLMNRRRERMDRSKRRTETSAISDIDKEKNRRELTRVTGSAD